VKPTRSQETTVTTLLSRRGRIELQKALAFYRSVGATFFARKAEELLPATA